MVYLSLERLHTAWEHALDRCGISLAFKTDFGIGPPWNDGPVGSWPYLEFKGW
jgi:hypothetical protein